MEEKNKDVHIQFIVKEDTRDNFKEVCRENGYNPSAWLRLQVENLINKHEKSK